jgi:adenylate cyclase
MTFFEELKRRNVVKVAVLYVIASWLILQVADVLSSLLPVPEWTGSLVFIFLALGFPLVMTFSWVYELTPEGLKREREVDRSQSITHETGRKINIVIIVMLALAIGLVVLDRLVPRHAPVAETVVVEETVEPPPASPSQIAGARFAPAPDRSIAVLPFADMSPDKDQEYLSDGLSEELLNLLAKIPELRVASRTSAFSFKGKNVKIADVATELNVGHVLEGSVRKAGNKVRITAQLIDASHDVHLWSETWDRNLDDVFAIQDEIAANVVEKLKIALLGEAPSIQETKPEAYNLYLQARHLQRQGSGPSMLKSVEMFNQVLAIDPDYAPAWVGLSTAYTNLAGSNVLPTDEGYTKAREAAEKAIAIDPDNGQAYSTLAWNYDNYAGDYATAAGYYQKALALAPNDDKVLNGVATLLQTLGRYDEAVTIYTKLTERDPVNPTPYNNLGVVYINTRDFGAATRAFDKALALSPDMLLARIYRGYMFYVNGDTEGYLQAFARLSDDTGVEVFRLLSQATAYPEMGRETEGAAALARAEEEFGDTSWAYVIATIHARQGRADEAFEWLERAFAHDGAAAMAGAEADMMLDSLHEDPRWRPLLKKAGRLPEQLAAIQFDVSLPQ